jgi:hypothetical protein
MRTRRVPRWLLVALLPLVAPAAEAGYAITDEGGQTLVSRGRLKLAPRQGDVTLVVDVGRAHMLVADARRRLYWEGTVEQYCEGMRGVMASVTAEMEARMAAQLKDMPPAQREQVQQMMQQMRRGAPGGPPPGPPPQVTVEPGAEMATIAGMAARKYRVLANGAPYQEVWLTADAGLMREMDSIRAPDTFGRMSGCMASSAGGDRPEATAEYRKLFAEGWPLKLIFLGDPQQRGTTVQAVERRDIAEKEFAAPAGYRVAPLTELFRATP